MQTTYEVVATCQGKINAIVFFRLENLDDVSWLTKSLKDMDSDVSTDYNILLKIIIFTVLDFVLL